MNLTQKNEENLTLIPHKLLKMKEPDQQPEENGTPKIHTITDSSPEIPTNRSQCRSVPNTLKENNYKSIDCDMSSYPSRI